MDRKRCKARLIRLNVEKKMRKRKKRSMEKCEIIASHAKETDEIRSAYLEEKKPINLKVAFIGGMSLLTVVSIFVAININNDNVQEYLLRLLMCVGIVLLVCSIAFYADAMISLIRGFQNQKRVEI